MIEVHLKLTKYYIAVQDGRLDNREFDSFEEAFHAREEIKKLDVMSYRSTYVSSYTKDLGKTVVNV